MDADLLAVRQPKTVIICIESKSGALNCLARIGRLSFSKSGKSLNSTARILQGLKGRGFDANYFDLEADEELWILGARQEGKDRLCRESAQSKSMPMLPKN